jgi:short-subunit dehydrogenase
MSIPRNARRTEFSEAPPLGRMAARSGENNHKGETALITGASSGIGFHLAHQFAHQGHPLVIVAPQSSELEVIAHKLKGNYGVEVTTVAADLKTSDGAQLVFDKIESSGKQIEILVNNAGHGKKGKFVSIPIEDDLSMIRLNVEAVVRLTKLFLPKMTHQGHGRILNVASIAGFEPGPLLAIYHATKAFVLSFSEALAVELEKTGVSITALCPGATDTDFFPKAGMLGTRAFQKSKVMAPQEVAKLGYEALMRGDPVYVTGTMNKVLVTSRRLLSPRAQAHKNKKFYEDVPNKKRKRRRGDIEIKKALADSQK